jgi:hypothetical protein
MRVTLPSVAGPIGVSNEPISPGTVERWNSLPVWGKFLSAVGFVALMTVLQLTRQVGAPATDTIWAEDGRVFLTDALAGNSPLLVFSPLAGYMHLVPRTLAAFAALLPVGAAAVVFAVGPALIVSSLALYTYGALRELLPSLSARVAIATLVALLPAGATESANNAANLHFYLVLGGFVALLHHPRSLGGTLAGSAFAFIAATSDPRTALLVPLAGWVLYRGSRNRRIIALTLLAGLVVQAAVVIASFGFGTDPTTRLSAPQFQESSVGHVPVLYGVRVVSHLFLGDRWILPAWERFDGWLAAAGLVVLGLVAVGVGVRRSTRRIGLLILGYSVGYYAFQAMAWGTFRLWPFDGGWAGNSRYLIVPQVLLAIALALLIEDLARDRGGLWRAAFAGFIIVLYTIMALHLRVDIIRSAGPRWSTELAEARRRCEGAAERVVIPITPPWSPDWAVRTDCARIR